MNKKTLAWIATAIFSLASGMSQVSAQDMNRIPAAFTQEDLDQMLAPIALYPDSLLAQVLMASTYPLEVVQAARFVDSRPGLQGDELARAIAPMPWDPSVKSLAQFPSVLAMMNDKLDWTQRLGDAFLSQQANVMDTVQNLRIKAQIAGNLQSSSQQRIVQQDQVIVIEPVNPQVIYVPYYNPTVVYGGWWWPQRPPVYWAPPPRYRPPSYNVSINVGIFFGAGTGIVRSVYSDARPDWRQHHVLVNNVRINNVVNNNVTNNVTRNVTVNNQPVVWQHNRRGGPNGRPDVGNVSRPNAPAAAPAVANAAPPQRPAQPPTAAGPDNRDRNDRNNNRDDRNGRNDPREPREQNARPPQALMAPNNAPAVPAQAPQRPQPTPQVHAAPPAPAAPQARPAQPAPAARPQHQEHEQRAERPEQHAQPRPQQRPQQEARAPAPQEARAAAPRPQERHEPQARPEPKPQQQREERGHRGDDK